MITPCPTCREPVEDTRPVDVLDDGDETVFEPPDDAPADLSEVTTYETVRCCRFLPCGHVFERESLVDVLDAIHELESLEREMQRTTEPSRMHELKEYEIPAARNAVARAEREVERRPEAEEREAGES